MTNNIKKIFFVLTLVTLLATVGAVCAADDTNSTITTDTSVSNAATISDTASDTVAVEPVTTTSNDNKVDTKTIEKEDKNVKTETTTVEVNNIDELNSAIQNATTDEYIINLNEGNYISSNNIYWYGNKNILVNGNNQRVGKSQSFLAVSIHTNINITIRNINTASAISVDQANLILENCNIQYRLDCYTNGNITLKNSTMNNSINLFANVIICDDVSLGENFKINNNGGKIIVNNTNIIYPYINTFSGNSTLTGLNINKTITNNENLTLNNCTLNSTITNNGVLIISDDTIFGENFILTGNGQVIINDTNKILQYMDTYNGNYTLENMTINTYKANIGNLTITNSTINNQISNSGNLTISNSTINSSIYNNGNLTIADDTIFGENFQINGNGQVITNNVNRILPYMTTYNANYTLENMTINTQKTNNGNLTVKNSTILSPIINNGNLTLTNSTINSTITNNGILTIDDDVIFDENFQVTGNGQVIINDTSRIIPYMSTYNANYTLENMTINTPKTNNGNLTLINCTINTLITNYGNLSIENSIFSNINCSLSRQSIAACIDNKKGAILSLKDTQFINNGNDELFTDMSESDNYGNFNIKNGLIVNYGIISTFDNCSFINNTIPCYTTTSTNIDGFMLNITNSLFENNTYGAIRTNNLTIINTQFLNNTKTFKYTDYSGPGGPKGTAILLLKNSQLFVDNCTFVDNSIITNAPYSGSGSQGGAIFTDKQTNVSINNSIFKNNYIDTNTNQNYEVGCGGAIYSYSLETDITNCIFENNNVTGIAYQYANYYDNYSNNGYGGAIYLCYIDYSKGKYNITNNTFYNNKANYEASSICISGNIYGTPNSQVIINRNNFTNNTSPNDTILINKITNCNITENTYENNSINFETYTLEIPEKIYNNENITIRANITLQNPQYYDADILEKSEYLWYIDGTTTTNNQTEMNLTVGNENIIVYIKPTIAQKRSNIVTISPTVLNEIIITPENINRYIFEGEVVTNHNSRLIFQGDFTNLGEIYNNKNEIIFDGSNATFTNTSFIIEAENNTIQNMNINNTDTSQYIITLIGNNNNIINNTLTQYNHNRQTAAIYNNNVNNNKITNNTINVTGPALSITYEGGSSIANTQAILSVGGQDNQITYNNITVQNSTDPEEAGFSTIEAITAPMGTNNTISYNNINCTGARFNYGINTLENVIENKITYNNITVTGYRYADGIQVGNGAKNNIISNNNINITCLNTTPVDEEAISYGIIVTSQGGQNSEFNNITKNNITINGTVNYGMEIYTAPNTDIRDNNITLTGVYGMGIGFAHSPDGITIRNNITITGDSTRQLNSVTEEIQPENTGIRVQQESNNILINNNIIKIYDEGKKDTTISIENSITGAKVTNNKLTSSTGYGQDTINAPATTNMRNNIITTNITTSDVTNVINTPTTLTATVTTVYGDNINGGTVTFTDANGNTIATAAVTDGTATATATFKQSGESTITATYTPTSTGLTESTTTATLTIKDKFQTSITIDEITATAGETITIKANVLDENGDAVTSGKVTFKVNGKTVKDANGKVVYAKVVDGVATAEYTVPENLGGQDITVTAVYSGTNKYNKETTTITTTVTAPEAKLTITPITSDVQTGSTVTLNAKVAIGDKAITTGKIVFKVNGKTVKDENGKVIYAKVDPNGEVSVDYTIPESFKAGTYNIEAVFTASGYDKLTDNTTMTVVKS